MRSRQHRFGARNWDSAHEVGYFSGRVIALSFQEQIRTWHGLDHALWSVPICPINVFFCVLVELCWHAGMSTRSKRRSWNEWTWRSESSRRLVQEPLLKLCGRTAPISLARTRLRMWRSRWSIFRANIRRGGFCGPGIAGGWWWLQNLESSTWESPNAQRWWAMLHIHII